MIKEIMRFIKSAFTWIVIITPWERGIRVRAGKHMKECNPGIHLRIPVLDCFYKQSIRRRSCIIPSMTITTKDGQTMTVSGFFWYEIYDVVKLYNTLHDAQDTIESEVAGIVSSYIISHNYQECDAEKVCEYVLLHIHLGQYGLSGFDFKISTHAKHKTYRLMTGAPKEWNTADELNTNRMHQEVSER